MGAGAGEPATLTDPTRAADAAPPSRSPILTWVPILVLGVLLVGVAAAAGQPLTNTDTFFHLRFGREFLSGWSPWDPGHLGAFDSAEWVPTQWLTQIAYAGTEQALGTRAVAWLGGALIMAYAVTVWCVVRAHTTLTACTVIAPTVVLASSPFLSVRPQVISFIFTVVCVHLWMRTRETGRAPWGLVPLTWVWAMCHGMWPIALVTAVAAVIGLWLDRAQPGVRLPRAGHLLAVVALSAAVTLLTPVGPRLFSAVLLVTSRGSYFEEWAPPDFTTPYGAALAALVALTLVAFIRGQSTSWLSLMILLLAGGWALYSTRTLPIAAATIAPLLAEQLQRHLPTRDPVTRRETRAVTLVSILGLVLMTVLLSTRGGTDYEVVPPWVDDQLDTLTPGTPVVTAWERGGYVLWRHPELDTIIHGYGDVFTDDELERNVTITESDEDWAELVRDTGAVDAFLAADSSLAYNLELAGWQPVQEDEDWVVLEAPSDWLSEPTR